MLPATKTTTTTATTTPRRSHHLDNNTRNNTSSGGTTRNSNNTSNNGATQSKRNSGMIFRIEHLIPASGGGGDSRSSNPLDFPEEMMRHGGVEDRSSKRARIQRAGVCVSQFIPKDTVSELIATQALLTEMPSSLSSMDDGIGGSEEQQTTRTYCTLTSQNVLCMTAAILRRIKLSEDIPSYNALFEVHGGQVRLRTVHDMQRDDEIVAWFGEETTLLMGIPFLTPLNIQGNNRYTCHLCSLTFETPNPLKIHLALGCGRHSMDILWVRLHYAVCATMACTRHLLPATTSLPSTLATMTTATEAPSSSSPASRSPPSEQQRLSPLSLSEPLRMPHFSAFKPIAERSLDQRTSGRSTGPTDSPPHAGYPLHPHPHHHHQHQHHPHHHHQHHHPAFAHRHSHTSLNVSSSNSLAFSAAAAAASFLPTISSIGSTMTMPTSMSLPPLPSSTAGHSHNLNNNNNNNNNNSSSNPLNAAAQIEAIVSNMGASKQGHLCIYCGKVYSRKYGLKIHIRTHTGFKPLKCKFCLRPFGDPSNLNKHVRLHLQTTSGTGGIGGSADGSGSGGGSSFEGFKCHLCHKTLARRRDLQRHIESRHAEFDGPLLDVESK